MLCLLALYLALLTAVSRARVEPPFCISGPCYGTPTTVTKTNKSAGECRESRQIIETSQSFPVPVKYSKQWFFGPPDIHELATLSRIDCRIYVYLACRIPQI
jgi:hypothetical protein